MILARDNQAIVAQCTPKGSGAIALIRISGDNAFDVAAQIAQLASKKNLTTTDSHTIHYGSIIDDQKNIIDHVMFFLMRGPRTFTGQDTVEITCHNNQFIIERIIAQAITHGARHAGAGEFTKRSFLNGKIDLIQAEAINELISAATQLSLKQSLAQLDGSFSQWLVAIEKRLVHCLALSEASFEFIDEEDMAFGGQIKEMINTILENITAIKKTFNQQQQLRQGIRIAIIGSVNAGKSSLFNALLNQRRAIVTDIAGTTRDTIEAGLYVDSNYWTLVDTAGLRQTDDVIEKEGIRRSFEEAKKADVVIVVYDQSRELTQEEQAVYQDLIKTYYQKVILVANKTDLPTKTENPFDGYNALFVSSETKLNIDLLHKEIKQKIKDLFSALDSPFLLNQRHFNVLLELENKLHTILSMTQDSIAYELLSLHLKDALESLTELTGKSISEKGMDAVFREFCVGK
ncbi:MAG: tRNA uridine-5-carboxymethylaminomethyl(34) synthesis GTPase MnmE [Candidatus Babeliales bacterium]